MKKVTVHNYNVVIILWQNAKTGMTYIRLRMPSGFFTTCTAFNLNTEEKKVKHKNKITERKSLESAMQVNINTLSHTYTQTHTHTHIYVYI